VTDWAAPMSMFDYDARPVTPVPVLVGTRASRGAYAIRDFLSRNGYPFEWVDAGQPDAVLAVLGVAKVEPSALPLCILPDGSRLASATVEQVAAGLGMVGGRVDGGGQAGWWRHTPHRRRGGDRAGHQHRRTLRAGWSPAAAAPGLNSSDPTAQSASRTTMSRIHLPRRA
jgi:hypothetical protein